MYFCSKTILDCNTLSPVYTKSRRRQKNYHKGAYPQSIISQAAATTKFRYPNKNASSHQAVPLGSLVSTLPMLPKSECQCSTGVAFFTLPTLLSHPGMFLHLSFLTCQGPVQLPPGNNTFAYTAPAPPGNNTFAYTAPASSTS